MIDKNNEHAYILGLHDSLKKEVFKCKKLSYKDVERDP